MQSVIAIHPARANTLVGTRCLCAILRVHNDEKTGRCCMDLKS